MATKAEIRMAHAERAYWNAWADLIGLGWRLVGWPCSPASASGRAERGGTAVGRLLAWFRARRMRGTERMLHEFVAAFPGRCPICSFHRYGYTHGYESSPKPKPHRCPEEPPPDAR